jgi:hypothetical protein
MGGHQYRDRPDIHLGPLTLAWHAITIAPGSSSALSQPRARWTDTTLPTEPMYSFAALAAVPRPTLFVAAAEAG